MRKTVIIINISTKSLLATSMLWTSGMAACQHDNQCRDGFYCVSSVCQECYNCTKYYMHPAEGCSKSITDCGDCLAGYVPADDKLEGCVSPKTSLPYWPALLAFLVALLCCLLGLLVRRILRKKNTADLIHPRPGLATADDKTTPTAPPPEECVRLNPGDAEGHAAARPPAADAHHLESGDAAPLLDTSPPPYSTVLNEIRTSHPNGAAVRAPGDVIAHGQPSPNGLVSGQYDRHEIGAPIDHSSDGAARRPWAPNGNDRNCGWEPQPEPAHPRSLRGHPKDSRVWREHDVRQRARKYNNPIYDDNQNVPDSTPAPNDSNEVPEWLQDETTTESLWTPHAPSTADSAPAASQGVAIPIPAIPSSTQPEASNRNALGARLPRVRVTTRARSDDEGPQRSRRRVATSWTKLEWDHTGSTSFQIKKESSKSVHPVESSEDNIRVMEVADSAVAVRAGGAGPPSPPAPGPADDLTPDGDGRRPLYNYSIINIQPELSIVAKIDL